MRGYVHGWDDDLELAINDYESAAKIDRKFQDFTQGARYNFVDKDYKKAIELFNKVIQNKVLLFIVYNLRGNCYYETGEFQKAIADHTEAIKLNSDFYGNYINRANAYNQTGQFDRAIADCNKSISINPNNFYGYHTRGVAYAFMEEYSKAITDINQAIKLDPNKIDAYGNRAFCNYRLENYLEAIYDYTKVLELHSSTKEISFNEYIFLAHSYLMLKEYDKASADIDMVLKLDPGNENALYVRGEIRAARAAQ